MCVIGCKDAEQQQQNKNAYIKTIRLIKPHERTISPLLIQDCNTALNDLKHNSYFQPVKDRHGPYHVECATQDNRLLIDIKNIKNFSLPFLVLSLTPYRRLIKDYFMIVQSYDDAMKDGQHARIEAIDMGRRGIHNEGAELLKDRLSDKVMIDTDTARRLFTLICVLHTGKAHTLR